MAKELLCGEALMQLLARYGVDTVFGIPGVHTLELYRGLSATKIRHVQCRHEQGAGFMADGYARASGRPGVCVVISGPGVTNAATPLGQAFADSVPVLCISAVTESASLGKGWGCLHEITDQQAVTAPLTGLSATAHRPEDLPELIGQAFAVFESGRPRPVHIAVPIDVLEIPVEGGWATRTPPSRPQPDPARIAAAAEILSRAERPTLLLGGGAVDAGDAASKLAERLAASVIATNAGKGVVPDNHPLSLSGCLLSPSARDHLGEADVVLVVGSELAETDSFVERLPLNGRLIRLDIDPRKINDLYPPEVGIVADARAGLEALLSALPGDPDPARRAAREAELAAVRERIVADFTPVERKHAKVWQALRAVLPADTAIWGDITQIVYTGAAAFPVDQARTWSYPAGFCTLGCGLPMAIGAKCAQPRRPMIAVAGDGGFLFTLQELAAAVEEELPLPILLWNNDGLQQIRGDMRDRNIPPIGVNPMNPDYVALARAFGCEALRAESAEQLQEAMTTALETPKPTLIEVREDSAWLS